MSDVHVFRDTRRDLSGPRLLTELSDSLSAIASSSASPALVLDALLRAGELESVLSDLAHEGAALVAPMTDALADRFLDPTRPLPEGAIDALATLTLPTRVRASPPEGFAYYALHPGDIADLVRRISIPAASVVVIGIRTIGSTLSAVAAAAIRRRGLRVERFTVRPGGHAHDRVVRFGLPAQAWLRARIRAGTLFFIVDEGPGLSGSSLLAVADALVAVGAPRARVAFLCSRAPAPRTLIAPDADRRFAAFTLHATGPTRAVPEEACVPIDGGAWRRLYYPDERRHPPVWSQLERRKLLSRDGRRLFKYEGLGRWGAEVRERAETLHAAGFGPSVTDAGDGFLVSPWIHGAPLGPESLTTAMVHRLSAYCAFRARAFPADGQGSSDLQSMLHKNALVVLGRELGPDVSLPLERPVIPDARMLPHEWISAPDALPLKMDGVAHGDDHLFPGPTDVAWDLAGVLVEWRMGAAARRVFLDGYRAASGDHCDARLPAYLFAYTLSRVAWTIAAAATSEPVEAARLLAAEQRYRAVLERLPSSW